MRKKTLLKKDLPAQNKSIISLLALMWKMECTFQLQNQSSLLRPPRMDLFLRIRISKPSTLLMKASMVTAISFPSFHPNA